MQSVPSDKKRQNVKKKQGKTDKKKGIISFYRHALNTPNYRGPPAPIDPYRQQKVLINTLTNYLNRLTLTTVSLPNNSSSVDSSADEITAHVKWDTDQGSFLQKKVDQDDKVTTGRRKSKRKKAVATNKVR